MAGEEFWHKRVFCRCLPLGLAPQQDKSFHPIIVYEGTISVKTLNWRRDRTNLPVPLSTVQELQIIQLLLIYLFFFFQKCSQNKLVVVLCRGQIVLFKVQAAADKIKLELFVFRVQPCLLRFIQLCWLATRGREEMSYCDGMIYSAILF